nr:ADP-ribosylation factor-like protein [Candidatus Njordarchaeota archaeon]
MRQNPYVERPSSESLPTVQFKIVFWGTSYCGKTTALRFLASKLRSFLASNTLSVETTDQHTLYLDYVPIMLPFAIGDRKLNSLIHLVTTTGQRRFLCTRERAAQGADTVIFVVDSSAKRVDDNIRSFDELMAFTNQSEIPVVVQANKQDLDDALKIEEIRGYLNLPRDMQIVPTVATTGKGLSKLFFTVLRQVLKGVASY